jgi:L-asparagine transporter-like permease
MFPVKKVQPRLPKEWFIGIMLTALANVVPLIGRRFFPEHQHWPIILQISMIAAALVLFALAFRKARKARKEEKEKIERQDEI